VFRTTGTGLLQLELTSNTFAAATALFSFGELPPPGDGAEASTIALTANLLAKTPAFVRTDKTASPDKLKSLFSRSELNVRDPESAKDNPAYAALKEFSFELATNPAEDRFLCYPASSELTKAGPKGTPVGVAPR
jgi:hypothetical protein